MTIIVLKCDETRYYEPSKIRWFHLSVYCNSSNSRVIPLKYNWKECFKEQPLRLNVHTISGEKKVVFLYKGFCIFSINFEGH